MNAPRPDGAAGPRAAASGTAGRRRARARGRVAVNARAIAVVVLALAAGACAETRPFDARRPAKSVPFTAGPVESPVRVVRGVVLVPTMIDGRGPFTFALDTGSTTVVVSEATAEAADLRPERRAGSIVTEAGRTDGTVLQATIRDLRIGDARFGRVGALVADLDGLSKGIGRKLDGILGMPLLTQHLWTFDPARAVIRLEEGALPLPDDGEILALVMDDGLPALRIDVAGRPVTAIVDTGQRMALSLSLSDAAALEGSLRVIGDSVGQVLDGEVRRDVARLDGDVRVGPIVLRAPPVLLGRASRLGMTAFQGRTLTFDLANGRLRVARPDADGN